MDQSLVGDGRRRVAPIGNEMECVPLVTQHVSATVLCSPLTVVYIVSVSISHIFWIFHIQYGVYVWLVFIFHIVKNIASLILSLFLEKLYPIYKAFPTH